MSRRNILSAVSALAVLAAGALAATSAGATPAGAPSQRPGHGPPAMIQTHGHFHGGGGGFGRGRFYGGFYPSYGYYYAPDYYYAPTNCGWLHHKAVETGSRYWWRRYRACIG